MLTIQDKKYLKKNFATKKYLDENFATKAYLDENFATKKYLDENFATKAYLDENFATKKDLRVFATTKQLNQLSLDVGSEFERVYKRFDKLEDLIKDVLLEFRSTNRKLDVTIKRVDKLELAIA